ncbi:MAG: alpha/beta hydrolase [Alphaproteobacteria bacterium]|nr:alpha/beta hydrolase [Alphaproteobacteria bacterium]
MGAWTWQFVVQRLRAAGRTAEAWALPGVGERAGELSTAIGNEAMRDDVVDRLEREDLREVILVGHSFGSLITQLVADRVAERLAHLVILDGGFARDGQSIFGRIPEHIVAKRRKLVTHVGDVPVLPFAPPGSLIIDDPDLAIWTHRQLTPHPLRCYTDPIALAHPPGNGLPMTYVACTSPRYPVSAGNHERAASMPGVRFRPIAAGHNCILSAPDLVARELLEIP